TGRVARGPVGGGRRRVRRGRASPPGGRRVTGWRGLVATMRGAFAEAAANRGALWSQMFVMAGDGLGGDGFWVLVFGRVGDLDGWNRDRIALLLAVLTTSGGIALGLLANARRLGSMAVAGELDPVLGLPVPPLAYVLVRRVEPTNLGDIAFGIILFAVL